MTRPVWTNEEKKRLREDCIWKLDLCGCGSGRTWEIVLFLLEKAEDHDKNGSFYDDQENGFPWVEFGAHVLDSAGLLEHGTGIGWAWLTEEGRLLLRFLREFGWGKDDVEWPNWATGAGVAWVNGEVVETELS